MQKPYFYIIEHISSNCYYAGIKFSNPNSENFMTENGYKTSSKIVKEIILNEGLNSFRIKKIKHFNTKEDALNYEHKFLTRVDAKNNKKFLNMSNGDRFFVNKGGYKLKESTKQKMSKPKSQECIDKQNQEKATRDRCVYEKSINTRKANGLECHDEKSRNKISNANKIRWADENEKEKHSKLMKEYYKNNPISSETREKQSKSLSGENNPMHGKKHNEDTKRKMKEAWEKRKLSKKGQSFSEDDLF